MTQVSPVIKGIWERFREWESRPISDTQATIISVVFVALVVLGLFMFFADSYACQCW